MTKKPTFTTPPNKLKQKVGDGGIPAYLIKRCQDFLESNPVDFSPYAWRLYEELQQVRTGLERGDVAAQAAMERLINIVMQLKSNGSMFHFQLISMISDVMLRFLEKANAPDADFLDILSVYNRVLQIILSKKLTGNGGREGYALTQELHNACLRYYNKNGLSPT